MSTLNQIPEKGFYYHYKHEANGPVNNYAYEFLGPGFHTEENGVIFAIYRPLYPEAFVYKNGQGFDVRPLDMWLEKVTKEGKALPRFYKITDKELIAKLTEIKLQMYGT